MEDTKMKNILKYASLALMGALAVLSCKKAVNEESNERKPLSRTFTCVIASDDPDSKVAITDVGKATWEVGDKIMLHGGTDGADRKEITLAAENISADGKKATITVEGLDPYDRTPDVVSTYYAQYPASCVPSGNLYYECRFNNTNERLMAACNVGDTFVFYNVAGVISFRVSGDFDSYVFAGNNGETVGYDVYQVRVRDDGAGPYCNYWKPGNGSGEPSPLTSISGSVIADGTTVNYIGLPYGTNFTGGFNMKFLKGGEIVKTLSTSSARNVAYGKLLPLGDVTSALKNYVAPSNHDATNPAITGATALDESGTANCYIVDGSVAGNANKVFKFKAYKGNGTTNVGTIASVEVLWETYNNAESVTANSVIAAVDFDKQDAKEYYEICFKMPATLHAGNAVIAAKNAGGTILWSWHIWVPATTVTYSDYGIYTAGKAMCDRNLGALDVAVASAETKINVTSVGLVYQWGRKDPFPGPSSIETEGEYYGFAAVAGANPAAVTTQLSVEDAIKQPNTFAKGSSSWTTSSDITLWGDEASKTIYDPCPAGYRVPNRVKDNDNQLFKAKLSSAAGWDYNATKYWFTLGSPATVFPCSGYCDGGSFKATFRTVIWNAHPDGDNGYNIYVYAGPAFANYSHAKSRGYFVRCVAE